MFQVSELKCDESKMCGSKWLCVCVYKLCVCFEITHIIDCLERKRKETELLPDYNRDVSEPLQEQKSTRSICALIAKTGDVSSCPYNDNCRFSHDLQGFKDQVVEFVECAFRF